MDDLLAPTIVPLSSITSLDESLRNYAIEQLPQSADSMDKLLYPLLNKMKSLSPFEYFATSTKILSFSLLCCHKLLSNIPPDDAQTAVRISTIFSSTLSTILSLSPLPSLPYILHFLKTSSTAISSSLMNRKLSDQYIPALILPAINSAIHRLSPVTGCVVPSPPIDLPMGVDELGSEEGVFSGLIFSFGFNTLKHRMFLPSSTSALPVTSDDVMCDVIGLTEEEMEGDLQLSLNLVQFDDLSSKSQSLKHLFHVFFQVVKYTDTLEELPRNFQEWGVLPNVQLVLSFISQLIPRLNSEVDQIFSPEVFKLEPALFHEYLKSPLFILRVLSICYLILSKIKPQLNCVNLFEQIESLFKLICSKYKLIQDFPKYLNRIFFIDEFMNDLFQKPPFQKEFPNGQDNVDLIIEQSGFYVDHIKRAKNLSDFTHSTRFVSTPEKALDVLRKRAAEMLSLQQAIDLIKKHPNLLNNNKFSYRLACIVDRESPWLLSKYVQNNHSWDFLVAPPQPTPQAAEGEQEKKEKSSEPQKEGKEIDISQQDKVKEGEEDQLGSPTADDVHSMVEEELPPGVSQPPVLQEKPQESPQLEQKRKKAIAALREVKPEEKGGQFQHHKQNVSKPSPTPVPVPHGHYTPSIPPHSRPGHWGATRPMEHRDPNPPRRAGYGYPRGGGQPKRGPYFPNDREPRRRGRYSGSRR
ncbi:hypothetical protein P9112_004503 [Eukaryota sp. TZLM1-RC]